MGAEVDGRLATDFFGEDIACCERRISMALDPSDDLVPENDKFADTKARLRSLPLVERVALEVKLAKDLGLVITPDQLVSIGTPTRGVDQVEGDKVQADEKPGMPEYAANKSGGVDTDSRGSMAEALRAMGLGGDVDVVGVRDLIRRLDETSTADSGGSNVVELAVRLHERLELLAMRGDHPDLVAAGGAAVSKAVFGDAGAGSGQAGPGGTSNR
jgi:hypothetical protein